MNNQRIKYFNWRRINKKPYGWSLISLKINGSCNPLYWLSSVLFNEIETKDGIASAIFSSLILNLHQFLWIISIKLCRKKQLTIRYRNISIFHFHFGMFSMRCSAVSATNAWRIIITNIIPLFQIPVFSFSMSRMETEWFLLIRATTISISICCGFFLLFQINSSFTVSNARLFIHE